MASSRAIELRQSTGLTLANNYVCRNASGAAIGTCGTGILVQAGGSHTIGGHYVSVTRFSQGNTIANCQVGIHLSQTTANTVEANTVEDNSGPGVRITSSSNNVIGSLYDPALGASLGNRSGATVAARRLRAAGSSSRVDETRLHRPAGQGVAGGTEPVGSAV